MLWPGRPPALGRQGNCSKLQLGLLNCDAAPSGGTLARRTRSRAGRGAMRSAVPPPGSPPSSSDAFLATRVNLAGKVAVVTGGAGGLGRAVTLDLARAGVDVALIDRDDAGVARTV